MWNSVSLLTFRHFLKINSSNFGTHAVREKTPIETRSTAQLLTYKYNNITALTRQGKCKKVTQFPADFLNEFSSGFSQNRSILSYQAAHREPGKMIANKDNCQYNFDMPDSIYDFVQQQRAGFLQFSGARMALLDIQAGFWGIRRQVESMLGPRLTNSVLQQAGANGGASFASSFVEQSGLEKSAAFAACIEAYQVAGFGKYEIISMEWPVGHIHIRATDAIEAWMFQQKNKKVSEPICSYSAGVFVGFVNIIGERQDVVCVEQACQAKGDETCVFELIPASEAKRQTAVPFIPDPGLGRQLNLLEILFERMPMGIAVLDCEYQIQRYNPTWEDFAERYAPPSGAPLTPGVHYFDHLPGTESTVTPLFERVLEGETVRENSVRLESDGVVTFWDIVLAPLVENNEIVGILNVAVDATERVESRQNLEQRVEERTRQLKMLLDVTSAANSSLNLDAMLAKTLDLLVDLIGASRAGVGLLDEETGQLKVKILRPERTVDPADMAKILQAGEAVIESGEMLYVSPDISQGLVEPGAILPLQIRDRVLGILGIIGPAGGAFTKSQLALFKSIADQLGVAIENARLFAKAEEAAITAERNRLARDLHDAVTQTLFSSSIIADVLPKIWERNPEEGHRRLEELRQLTRGALSEMRTLLVELRPAALIDIDLGDLIGHQVNAFISRSRLPVEFERNCAHNPPPVVKEVFYRVTQEAFNNIAKHADAESVIVRLDCRPDKVDLLIKDDGVGFDPELSSVEGFGLGIMRERARNVSAKFEIQSQIRGGTRLRVSWQAPNVKEE